MKAWEKNIRRVVPYVPGEQPKDKQVIKLNTNENPFPPSPLVTKAIEEYKVGDLRKYPDPTISDLVGKLAQCYGLEDNQVFVGVGSDDVLGMAFLTFFNSEKPILFPDITYSFYNVWADLYRIPYKEMPLDEKFKIHKEDYYESNGGVVIANPNAPTTICEDLDFICDILDHNQDVIVIVDEAYIDFGGKSAVELISKYDNLLVVQTYSKSRALAGLRIGYAMGNPELIKALNDIKYSYNSYTLNSLSIRAGVASLEDKEYFDTTINEIIRIREKYAKELRNLGFEFPESKTNFLFVKHNKVSGEKLFQALREQHIYVRHFNGPRIKEYLRITIGTEQEMEALVSFLQEYLKDR